MPSIIPAYGKMDIFQIYYFTSKTAVMRTPRSALGLVEVLCNDEISKGVLQTIYDATHIYARPYIPMPGHTHQCQATHIDARPYTSMPGRTHRCQAVHIDAGHTGTGWGRSQFSEPLIHHPHPTHDTSFLPPNSC